MNNIEFVEKIIDIARNRKTLYVTGGLGFPLNDYNKMRVKRQYHENRTIARAKNIDNATPDTFAFDCSGLVKGVLWGWNGNINDINGGMKYQSNNVPDDYVDKMIEKCVGVSTDFSHIEIGELLHVKGHCGIYVGNNLCVECTPAWKNCVQFTGVFNTGERSTEYPNRVWTKHGKMPYIEYVACVNETSNFILSFQKSATSDGFNFSQYGCDGIWGTETENIAKKCVIREYNDGVYRYKNSTALAQRLMGMPETECDGLCGPKTTARIKAVQKRFGLEVDGHIGVNTWKYLLGVVK